MIVMGGPMDTWQEETYPWLKPEKGRNSQVCMCTKKTFFRFMSWRATP